MNREQRRASGPPGAGPQFGSAAAAAPAGTLAELFGAAVAQHRYRHILTLSPAHADSLHNLGLIALHRGDATAAVDLIGKAIEANDRTAEYHYNIALAWRALNRT